jgi:phosphohistidine phosphatase SixA
MRHGGDCIVAPVRDVNDRKAAARAAIVIRAMLALLLSGQAAAAQEAIYIVRHAERADQSSDSPLSTEGVGRAYKLRDMLRSAGVTHVFTSEFRRTIDTAKPLADTLRLAARALPGAPGKDVQALAATLAALAPRDRALVVGHSNTVPELLQALNVTERVTIADTEYDNLFIVVPRKDAPPTFLRLKF